MATEPSVVVWTRIPPELHQLLKKRAEENERSLTKEVLYCIKGYLKQEKEEEHK